MQLFILPDHGLEEAEMLAGGLHPPKACALVRKK